MGTIFPIDPEMLPRDMVLEPPLTDAEFQELSRGSESVSFERTKEGAVPA